MLKAVISGDLINSSLLDLQERKSISAILEKILRAVNPEKGSSAIFRGDSFQVLVQVPEDALLQAIIIRCSLITATSGKNKMDARLSIALGKSGYTGKNISMSDGEAHQLSGKGLDGLKERGARLGIYINNKDLSNHFKMCSILMDPYLNRLTIPQAEVILYALQNKTQPQIAALIGISQPAVNKRLGAGNWDIIKFAISYFQEEIKKIKISVK